VGALKAKVKPKPRKQVFSLVEAIHESEAAFRAGDAPRAKHKFEVKALLSSELRRITTDLRVLNRSPWNRRHIPRKSSSCLRTTSSMCTKRPRRRSRTLLSGSCAIRTFPYVTHTHPRETILSCLPNGPLAHAHLVFWYTRDRLANTLRHPPPALPNRR